MVGKTFAELIKDEDNAKLAEQANDLLGLGTPETSIPLQSGLSYEDVGAQFNEPAPDNYNEMVQSEMEQAPVRRSPAVDNTVGGKPHGIDFKGIPEGEAPAPDSPQTKLERLLEERKKAYEDAQNRQWKADLIAGLAPHLSQMYAGATAMNTKASVQAPKMDPIKVGDFTKQVDGKYKPELDALMKEYEALKDANKPMSEKDKIWADIMYKQLALGHQRADQGMYKFEEGQNRLWDKQLGDRAQKDEYSDKQTESLMGFDKTNTLLSDIEKKLDSGKYDKYLGPYASKWEKSKELNPLSSGMDADFAKFQSDTTDALSQYIKGLSGLTVSDKEREALLQSAPQVGDKPQTFRAKLQATRARLATYRKAEQAALAKYQGKTGNTVQPGKQPARGEVSLGQTEVAPAGTVERKTADGRIAIFDSATKQFIKYKD
jgi:hypothetical protein